MIDLKNAIVNRRIPKNRFNANLSSVESIIWKYKLSKDTIGISDNDEYKEIQIFEVKFKSAVDERALINIQKAIPYNILFVVGNVYYMVVDGVVLRSKLSLIESQKLYINAYSIHGILVSIIEFFTGIKLEDISCAVAKYVAIKKINKQIQIIEGEMHAEVQPKKKFEMHEELVRLRQQIKDIK